MDGWEGNVVELREAVRYDGVSGSGRSQEGLLAWAGSGAAEEDVVPESFHRTVAGGPQQQLGLETPLLVWVGEVVGDPDPASLTRHIEYVARWLHLREGGCRATFLG